MLYTDGLGPVINYSTGQRLSMEGGCGGGAGGRDAGRGEALAVGSGCSPGSTSVQPDQSNYG